MPAYCQSLSKALTASTTGTTPMAMSCALLAQKRHRSGISLTAFLAEVLCSYFDKEGIFNPPANGEGKLFPLNSLKSPTELVFFSMQALNCVKNVQTVV